ncbi:hypothetical protein [Pseudomonas sp.]|jgi:hypothetical protein|uniref:hypothetical protein n=1 Tax=Pseudomonas sp. TaxID=306 RepID=UPI0028A20F9A|nr:hypothetical protein [Pseudomonas sp.]
MALTIEDDEDRPDNLSELLNHTGRNNRHDVWLWLCLYVREKLDLDLATCNGATMRDEIARALKIHPRFINRIPEYKDHDLVPNELLKWITKDERQYQWLYPKVDKLTGYSFPLGLIHLTRREHLIAMLDIWQIDIAKKAREIEFLSDHWRRHTAADSQFDWFADKKEGTKRCVFAWNWIEKNLLGPVSRQLPIANYREMLMYFDQAELGPNELKAIIKDIKNRWNRQQFNDRNSHKRQLNVMLSISVIDQLDVLADRYNLKRPEVLETLIKLESESPVHLNKAR